MKSATNRIRGRFPGASALFGIFFIIVMLDGLYITDANYQLLSQVRFYSSFLLAGLILAFLVKMFFFSRPSKGLFIYSCIHLLLLLYGFILSLFFGGVDYLFADPKLILYLFVSLGFGYSMVSHFLESLGPERSATSVLLPVFFYSSLVYLALSDAIRFGPLPYFNFGQLDQDGRSYSHATSALFGIASLYFLLSSHDRSLLGRLIPTLVSIVFLYLSAMGGARGDFAIALMLYFVILLKHRSIYSYIMMLGLAGLVIYILSDENILQKFLVLERYLSLVETGTFGERDVLAGQSISLLAENPLCILGGCGFNYFQYFYAYEYGLYPHNFLLELAITFGILVTFSLSVLMAIGARRLYADKRVDKFFFYFSAFVLLAALKSGSLIDFKTLPVILFLAFVPYFCRSATPAARLTAPLLRDATRPHRSRNGPPD